MKKLFTFLMITGLMLMSSVGWGQGLETFDNFNVPGSSYESGTFIGQDGSTWTYDECRGDYEITGTAIMIGRNRTPQSNFYSGTISGGIGTLNFNYKQAFGTDVDLEVYVNDDLVGSVTTTDEQNVVKNSGEIHVNVEGDFVIKFINRINGAGQVVVDDVEWTGFDPKTTSLPYSEDFDIDLGDIFVFNVNGSKPWTHNAPDGNGVAEANGFGGEDEEEHWLVLPGINMDQYVNVNMTFLTKATFGTIDANNYLKLFYSTNYPGSGDPTSESWDWIEIDFAQPGSGAVGTNEIDTPSGNIDLSEISGDNVYLAFKYYSTNSPTRWRVDDIEITGMEPGIEIESLGFTYSQDFNTLAQSGGQNDNEWSDNDILGWYWQGNSARDPNQYGYIASHGTSTTAAGHSYGTIDDPDRAMGVLTGSGHDLYIGVLFKNSTGGTINLNDILISYTGEQWRRNSGVHGLVFEYIISATPISDLTTGTYTTNPELNFDPIHTGTGSALDGNDPDNRTLFSNIELSDVGELNNGEYLMLRWSKEGTNSNGLAIDDFNLFLQPVETAFIGTGNWSDAARWSDGPPGPGTNVTISGEATVDHASAINNLTIENGGSLLDDELLTINGTFTMQRNIPNVNNWHLISAPSSGMAIAGSDFVGVPVGGELPTNFDFYAFDETHDELVWVNYRQGNLSVNPAFGDFVDGKGYLVAYAPGFNSGEFVFTGVMNTGDIISPALTYTGAGQEGWNLLGNPYPSAIQWKDAYAGQFQQHAVAIYDPSHGGGGGYVNIEEDGFIPANQGFFALVDSEEDGSNFTFTNAMRAHGGSFMKNNTTSDDQLILRLATDDYWDESTLRIREGSEFNRDRQDAVKMFSFNQAVPQLYSYTSDNIQVSINSIPAINEDATTQLGMRIPADGLYTLSLIEMTGAFGEQEVYLKDTELGIEQNLSEVAVYDFSASAGDLENRFLIHFGALSLDDNRAVTAASAYVHGNTLYILNARGQTQLEVFDLQGRLLQSQSFKAEGLHSQPIKLPAGMYVVRIMDAEGVSSTKIIVK